MLCSTVQAHLGIMTDKHVHAGLTNLFDSQIIDYSAITDS